MGHEETKPGQSNPFVGPLSAEEHSNLRFIGCDACGKDCCNGSHYLHASVLLDDLFDTAKLFPVVFSRNNDVLDLFLVYTLRKDVPCPYWVDGQGCRVYDSVRPMACRIYPFSIMPRNDGSPGTTYTVCVDSRCPGLEDNGASGMAIITDEAAMSPAVVEQFIGRDTLEHHQENLDRTRRFLRLVKELDLLVRNSMVIGAYPTRPGDFRDRSVRYDVYKISRERLDALAPESVMLLHREGFFNAIYTHLNSLSNFPRLFKIMQKYEPAPIDLLDFSFGG